MIRPDELIIDSFAGGGGASTGIEMALGRPVDIAINHDPAAIDMHKMNHPHTQHYCESVWDVDPVQACNDRPVGLAWFSPDCKHFSKAKGGTPVEKKIRGLAWVAVKWAASVPVRILMLENVEEFMTWGPLRERVDSKGMEPDPDKRGETFEAFIQVLTVGLKSSHPAWTEIRETLGEDFPHYDKLEKGLGYQLKHHVAPAYEQDAPTTRKRFYMVARNDQQPVYWPLPTRGKPRSLEVQAGKLQPWLTAADCIDWSIPVKSIFGRKKPLAEKTMIRIAKGIQRFVIEAEKPFIVPNGAPFITEHANGSSQRNMPADEPLRTICASVKGGHFALVTAFIARHFGQSTGHEMTQPLGTVTCGGGGKSSLINLALKQTTRNEIPSFEEWYADTKDYGGSRAEYERLLENGALLCTSNMIKFRGKNIGSRADEPIPTISAGGNHIGEVRAFLIKYYGTNVGQPLDKPIQTITTKHRFGLVTIQGEEYQIVDIGMRMLEPHELFKAMGFPDDYIISHDSNGKKITKASQVARCGNAVCPPYAKALVESNVGKSERKRIAA